jgi:hypothetical protein
LSDANNATPFIEFRAKAFLLLQLVSWLQKSRPGVFSTNESLKYTRGDKGESRILETIYCR